MEVTMFNRKATLLTALTGGILAAYGAMTILADGNGRSHDPALPQIDAFDLMSKARGVAE
jgi:hypothetical protein